MKLLHRLDWRVRNELLKQDDWIVEPGTSHHKIKIEGRLALVVSRGSGMNANPRAAHNAVRAIRNVRREIADVAHHHPA